MVDTKILCAIALKAGDLIMEIYESNDFQVDLKKDSSPVTRADRLANDYIIQELQNEYSHIPILSEESEIPDYEIRKEWKECFIVDPLDGTKEFLNKNGEFTVNIAYVQSGKVVEGVIYAPAKKDLYYTHGGKSYKNKDQLPLKREQRPYKVLVSRSHLNEQAKVFIENQKIEKKDLEVISMGSSLKLCIVAEGVADLYPRFGPTKEWDIAAGQAIVEQAGGVVLSYAKTSRLTYNKESLVNLYFLAEF